MSHRARLVARREFPKSDVESAGDVQQPNETRACPAGLDSRELPRPNLSLLGQLFQRQTGCFAVAA